MWHIDILSVASGLISQQENRTLDMQVRDHADRIFGNIKGQSRMSSTATFEMLTPNGTDKDAAFLQARTLRDGTTPTKWADRDDDEEHVQSWVRNVDRGYEWTAEQIWGFEVIDGKRYHTRRVVVRSHKGDQVEHLRLVYDYTGPIDGQAQAEDDGLAYGE
jgi:hypothetical protein